MRPQVFVPLHTYPAENTERVAPHAAGLARHLGADLHALVLMPAFPDLDSPLGDLLVDVPALIADRKATCRTRGAALTQALEAEAAAAGVALRSAGTECRTAATADLIARRARYYDLTLFGMGPGANAIASSVEAVLFGSGRPLLLVPEAAEPRAFDHVMIAWDGSRVAARAVADARDLLARARTVTVATVEGEKRLPEPGIAERLVEQLHAGGCQAQVAPVPGEGRPIADILQGHAREAGAGLLVMGGFGHSRLREFVLGGATAGVLRDLRLPVLISH